MNRDIVENHFSQLRGAHGQNENLTNLLTQAIQNAIILGQTSISKKRKHGRKHEYGVFKIAQKAFVLGEKENSSGLTRSSCFISSTYFPHEGLTLIG